MPTGTEKLILAIGGAGLIGALVLGSVAPPRPAPSKNNISLSVPSRDTTGDPVTITARYTSPLGQAIPNATLYLFGGYSTSQASPSYSSLTLVKTATTDSQGTATWPFTPSVAGYYYFDVSDDASNT